MANSLGGAFDPKKDYELTGTVTVSGTLAVTGTATGASGSALVTAAGTQTLTNKTLTAPTVSAAVLTTPTATGASISSAVTAYSADGAITKASGVALLTKAGVGAYTLALPTATTQDGMTIVLTSTTANAHVVTCANGFWAGETGGPFDKVTLAAFPGSSATLVAYQALWYVVSDQIATVGD